MGDASAAQITELGSGAGRKIRLLLDGWDNEFGAERHAVAGFELSDLPLRNRNWLEYMGL
jgi:uncharacterized SAM-dependent methyltransferase